MNELFEGYITILSSRLKTSIYNSKSMKTTTAIRELNDSIKYLKSSQEAYNKGDTNVSLEYLEMVPIWLREGNWQTLRRELQ